MPRERVIGNVNLLDLTKATSDSVAGIKSVGNANIVAFTRDTAPLLRELSIGNINASVELPPGADVMFLMGTTSVTRDGLRAADHPGHLVVMGCVNIHPDVSAEDLRRGLGSITVMGHLVCPDHLSGTVQSGGGRVVGQTLVYPPLKHVHFSSLVLDRICIDALADHSELAVVGRVRITEDVPADLLRRKIEKLFASSGVLCYPQHARPLAEILLPGGQGVTVVPEGHRFVEEPLELSPATLETLSDSRLYCTGRVVITADVAAPLLERKLKHLVARDGLLYPSALTASVAKLCDLLDTDAIAYEGRLLVVEDSERLRASRLDLQKEKLTIRVEGELSIDPDVAVEALLKRVARIHNLGVIRCTPEQAGAVEELLGIREGTLDDGSGRDEEGEDSDVWLANANVLAL